MPKPTRQRLLLFLTLLVSVTVSAVALAARPKPLASYVDKYATLQADQTGKKINNFNGNCTPVRHPKFTFAYVWGIPVKQSGEFHADHMNAVNTANGGTLSTSYRVTIDGKFVSQKEAKGTYRLHKAGCKTIQFDAKLSQ